MKTLDLFVIILWVLLVAGVMVYTSNPQPRYYGLDTITEALK